MNPMYYCVPRTLPFRAETISRTWANSDLTGVSSICSSGSSSLDQRINGQYRAGKLELT